jgi:hypothetical protein
LNFSATDLHFLAVGDGIIPIIGQRGMIGHKRVHAAAQVEGESRDVPLVSPQPGLLFQK